MRWRYLLIDARGTPIFPKVTLRWMDAKDAERWRAQPGMGVVVVDLPSLIILKLTNNRFQVFISEALIER